MTTTADRYARRARAGKQYRYTEHMERFLWSSSPATFALMPKGRRAGATHNLAEFVVELLDTRPRCKILWGDTIAGNVDRYFKRFFVPALRRNRVGYRYSKQFGLLEVGEGSRRLVDFRSADRPENWEGFGYDVIILNEAGIILRRRTLYEESVLPMLDSTGARLFAMGVPKALRYAKPSEYAFAVEHRRALRGDPEYRAETMTAEHNPFVEYRKFWERVGSKMTEATRRQELHGEFVFGGGGMLKPSHIQRVPLSDVPPLDDLRVSVGVDLAISKKDGADYTAIVVGGLHEATGRFFVLQVVRERLGFFESWGRIVRVASEYPQALVIVEEVAFQMATTEALITYTALNVQGINPRQLGNKEERFQRVASRFERGLVYIVDTVPDHYTDELLTFPNSKHKDQTDATAYAYLGASEGRKRFTIDWIG